MSLATAVIIGRQHRLMQQNGHDYVVAGQPADGFAFGLVLDGCGGRYQEDRPGDQRVHSPQSEVGSKLLGQFSAEWLASNLATAPDPCLDHIVAALFDGALRYLDQLIEAIPFSTDESRVRFLYTHLMATMVGFIITPQEACFFWSGDGYLCQDGQVTHLDSRNQPAYLAHSYLSGQPAGFERRPLGSPAQLSWLAVATDGWDSGLLANVSPCSPTLELQRWLNVQARDRQYFEDDGAIAVWCNQKAQPRLPEGECQ